MPQVAFKLIIFAV